MRRRLHGQNKQANRPFPNINGTVIPTFSTASNDYNSVNFRVEKRYSKGLALLVNYTIQKNLESGGAGPDAYSQNGGTSIAMDTYNLARERSYAPIDVPQIFSGSAAYELPFGPGKRWFPSGGLSGKVVGGWQVNYDRHAARRLSNRHPHQRAAAYFQHVQCGGPRHRPADGAEQRERRCILQSRGIHRSRHRPEQHRRAHSGVRECRAPRDARSGIEERGSFVLQEHQRSPNAYMLQFRVEMFNFTNTPTFFLPAANSPTLTCIGAPGSACNSNNPSFGKLSSGTATGRQIQFGMKLYF